MNDTKGSSNMNQCNEKKDEDFLLYERISIIHRNPMKLRLFCIYFIKFVISSCPKPPLHLPQSQQTAYRRTLSLTLIARASDDETARTPGKHIYYGNTASRAYYIERRKSKEVSESSSIRNYSKLQK